MSLFSCPNASRSLLSVAVRGISSKAARTAPNPFTPSRWLSSCAASARQGSKPLSSSRHTPPMSSYLPGSRRTFFSDKTIRKYEDLPKDYRDQVGLSFRSLDLTDSEVSQVFGKGINSKRANHLLRIFHGRRVAGTLDDPAFTIHTAQYTKDQKAKAMEYLRKSVPVNEVMNAGLRAEDELAQLEAELAEKETSVTQGKEEVAPHPKLYKPDPIYGESRFDQIRARNVAKRKALEAAEEEERKAAEARGEVASGPLAKLNTEKREIANPRIAEYAEAAQSDLEAPPEMKAWERILPSATVVALVIGFLAAVAMVYEEPSPRFRLLRDISTAHATVGAIIAVNALVFLGWRVPPLWKFFNKYMIMVVATVKPVTMFTAPFSHQKIGHLLMNMVPLWFVGTAVHEEIGRANFLTLYLACGALGFVGSLATYTMRGLMTITSLGASGATLGLCSAYFWEHRNDRFKFFGLPQDGAHGIIFLALLLVPQLAGFGKTVINRVDIASHLVGMLAGILGVEYINRARQHKEKQVIEVFPQEKGAALPRLEIEPEK
ncbi:Fc.00g066220.m01.CDS01 [Cosmosporella sp. VM-42]